MAASLIKLFVSASSSAPTATGGTVSTTVDPAVTRYTAVLTGGMITTDTTIPAASFSDDNGDPVVALTYHTNKWIHQCIRQWCVARSWSLHFNNGFIGVRYDFSK